jgi:hypothetical protein
VVELIARCEEHPRAHRLGVKIQRVEGLRKLEPDLISALGSRPAHPLGHLAGEGLDHGVPAAAEPLAQCDRDSGRGSAAQSRPAPPAEEWSAEIGGALEGEERIHGTPRATGLPLAPREERLEKEVSTTTPFSSSAASGGNRTPGEAQIHLVGILDHGLRVPGRDGERSLR